MYLMCFSMASSKLEAPKVSYIETRETIMIENSGIKSILIASA